MKKIVVTAFFLCVLATVAHAQFSRAPWRFWEIGVAAGAMNYSGDLAENQLAPSMTRIGGGVFGRYNFGGQWSARAQILVGKISGDDNTSETHIKRSFRFDTRLAEIGLTGEWRPLASERIITPWTIATFFTPYVFGGISATLGKSNVTYYGNPDLRPVFTRGGLPEDGQPTSFVAIPFGLGVRFDIDDQFVLAGEFGARPVLSDRIDGVSLNGNPDRRDWYYFAGLNFSYVFGIKKFKGY